MTRTAVHPDCFFYPSPVARDGRVASDVEKEKGERTQETFVFNDNRSTYTHVLAMYLVYGVLFQPSQDSLPLCSVVPHLAVMPVRHIETSRPSVHPGWLFYPDGWLRSAQLACMMRQPYGTSMPGTKPPI